MVKTFLALIIVSATHSAVDDARIMLLI